MRIGLVCSNYFNISQKTIKGTEIFCYDLINNLAKNASRDNFDITVFTSGESKLPLKVESVDFYPSSFDPEIIENGKHINFELALLSKAFLQQDNFDLYHINIGDGDIALPFASFINKPILITLHHTIDADFVRKYFLLFKNLKNIYFISVSDAQRKILPDLNYITTIYHGVDENVFGFNGEGGSDIMWAGRAIPEKGIDVVVEVTQRLKHDAKLFGIPRTEHHMWLQRKVLDRLNDVNNFPRISFKTGLDRFQLIRQFQKSKLFLFPIAWEEPFGLVLIEALACGTPVVAYARGSVPEIIKDGKTGFIVNPSSQDIRGDWIIKKTGIEGLCEAVEKIYSMPRNKYVQMRKSCRKHFEKNFTIGQMTNEYQKVYTSIIQNF